MASHELAVAKATFSAGLLRPDPTSISRQAISSFYSLLDAAIIQCTPVNVQKCKRWILENVVQSTARFTALGKYLTALTTNLADPTNSSDPIADRKPSLKRKRIHLLYIINDILYRSKYRASDASICGKFQSILVKLFGSAASFVDCPRHHQKCLDLLSIWEENGYYSKDYINELRQVVKIAAESGNFSHGGSSLTENGEYSSTTKTLKTAPFIMPAMHGDSSTPWYDLPAGNLMPHIVPNSTRPINLDMIQPLQLVAGPADGGLILAVESLLTDVEAIFGAAIDEQKPISDIDELGQHIILDEITGEVIGGEGYYGWSRMFCEKMKGRKRGRDTSRPGRNHSSQSRSSSRGAQKRRYSDSSDEEASSRPWRRRRSYSLTPSRSPSPEKTARYLHNDTSRSGPNDERDNRLPDADGNPKISEQRPSESPMYTNYPPSLQLSYGTNFVPPPPPPPEYPPTPPQNLAYNGQYPAWSSVPQNMQFNPPHPQHGSWNILPPPLGAYQNHPTGLPAGPAGWQPQMQMGNGRGHSQNGWNNNFGYQGRGGRGGYRGRGWS